MIPSMQAIARCVEAKKGTLDNFSDLWLLQKCVAMTAIEGVFDARSAFCASFVDGQQRKLFLPALEHRGRETISEAECNCLRSLARFPMRDVSA